MRFTGQPRHEKVDIDIAYRDNFQDAELVATFIESVRLLTKAVAEARVLDISSDSEARQWAKEFLVGYALLAIGEARSMLLLLSDRLNLHARIHLRSLYEYDLKLGLLLEDEEKVLKFRDAFAYEIREFATRLGKQPEEIDAEIERVLGIEDASRVKGARENRALGGSVRDQMRNDLQPEARYVGTFAWTSQVSHGSVLALNELAKATDGKADDLFTLAAYDSYGNALLYNSLWVILKFAALIEREFNVAVPGIDDTAQRGISINTRLRFTTPEQEERVQRLREEKRGRESVGDKAD
jgi:uncharacterized protein DUF5677